MWKSILLIAIASCVSCSGSNKSPDKSQTTENEKSEVPVTALEGQWEIENVVENDSSYVRPSEIGEGVTAYIEFREDNSFGVMTNCNHIGGHYQLKKDSLVLTEISSTEMACDNMELEEMVTKILPIINSVDCINDSITRLNSTKGDSYIVLLKTKRAMK